jgi:hypothetical protein
LSLLTTAPTWLRRADAVETLRIVRRLRIGE